VAAELGLTKAQVTEITSVQFEFVTRIMRQNTMEGIILPYMGKIKIKPEKIFNMHTYANKQVKLNTSTPQ
jgi:hypothetical protein